MDLKIGQTVLNNLTGQTEVIKTIKHGYINGYRADLWQIIDEEIKKDLSELPQIILTNICLGIQKWNKKFYGNYIYVDGVKYTITYNQKEELGKAFELDI